MFITNFRAVSFDEAGRVKQELAAKRAQHHPDDASIDFAAPALVITEPGRPRLTVTADTGTLSGDRQTVLFQGHVQATRDALPGAPATPESGPLKLTTDFLRVLPDKGIAETDRPVTIEEARGIIHGVGMTLTVELNGVEADSGPFQS